MLTSLLYERIMAYLIWVQFLLVLLRTEGGIDNDTKDLLKVLEAIFLGWILLEYILTVVYASRGGATTSRFAVEWIEGTLEKRAVVGALVGPLKLIDMVVIITFAASSGDVRLQYFLLVRTLQDNHQDSSMVGDRTKTYRIFETFWRDKKYLLLVTCYLLFTMWVLVAALFYLVGKCSLLCWLGGAHRMPLCRAS